MKQLKYKRNKRKCKYYFDDFFDVHFGIFDAGHLTGQYCVDGFNVQIDVDVNVRGEVVGIGLETTVQTEHSSRVNDQTGTVCVLIRAWVNVRRVR